MALVKLSGIHHRAMILYLEGKTHAEIGAELNRSQTTIDHWFIDPTFREVYDALCTERRESAFARIYEAAPDAAAVMQRLKKGNGMVAYMAAKDILDRAGLKPVEKQQLTGRDETPIEIVVRRVDASTSS